MRSCGYPVFIYFILLFVFHTSFFSPCTNKQKRSCLQSVSIPALPIWSSPQRLRQLFSQGRGGGTDIIVVMITDGCAPFTKTNFACSLKKATAPHFSSRAFRENMSTDQDGVTREYRASLFLFKCLKIQQGHSLHFMNAGLFLMSAVYKRRTRFYLNVERSVTGDDLKEVVSKQELPDGCKKLKLKAAKERDKS